MSEIVHIVDSELVCNHLGCYADPVKMIYKVKYDKLYHIHVCVEHIDWGKEQIDQT